METEHAVGVRGAGWQGNGKLMLDRYRVSESPAEKRYGAGGGDGCGTT